MHDPIANRMAAQKQNNNPEPEFNCSGLQQKVAETAEVFFSVSSANSCSTLEELQP
jgi:hypothetical protein